MDTQYCFQVVRSDSFWHVSAALLIGMNNHTLMNVLHERVGEVERKKIIFNYPKLLVLASIIIECCRERKVVPSESWDFCINVSQSWQTTASIDWSWKKICKTAFTFIFRTSFSCCRTRSWFIFRQNVVQKLIESDAILYLAAFVMRCDEKCSQVLGFYLIKTLNSVLKHSA